MTDITTFLEIISDNLYSDKFVKLIMSKKRNTKNDLKSIHIKPVAIKHTQKLSFVYKYTTKDITKNFEIKDSHVEIRKLIEENFLKSDLFITDKHICLLINKKGNSNIITKQSQNKLPANNHDRIKKRIIKHDNIYFKELGITGSGGQLKKNKNNKYRQINKYIEIIDNILRNHTLPDKINIVDMGSGKGYLTFALYDYLSNILKLNPVITGIEYKKELTEKCNIIARKAKFDKLKFLEGTIKDSTIKNIDMLIALHACDTATDEAIYKGITSKSGIIICSPCCHNQIRQQIKPDNFMTATTKFGILADRLAEIITDTIRALLLEINGYKTNIFEFIASDHTPKNILIVAIKQKNKTNTEHKLKKLEELKSFYGIQYHYLEKLLNNNQT